MQILGTERHWVDRNVPSAYRFDVKLVKNHDGAVCREKYDVSRLLSLVKNCRFTELTTSADVDLVLSWFLRQPHGSKERELASIIFSIMRRECVCL